MDPLDRFFNFSIETRMSMSQEWNAKVSTLLEAYGIMGADDRDTASIAAMIHDYLDMVEGGS